MAVYRLEKRSEGIMRDLIRIATEHKRTERYVRIEYNGSAFRTHAPKPETHRIAPITQMNHTPKSFLIKVLNSASP
jgi:hypothetical protein